MKNFSHQGLGQWHHLRSPWYWLWWPAKGFNRIQNIEDKNKGYKASRSSTIQGSLCTASPTGQGTWFSWTSLLSGRGSWGPCLCFSLGDSIFLGLRRKSCWGCFAVDDHKHDRWADQNLFSKYILKGIWDNCGVALPGADVETLVKSIQNLVSQRPNLSLSGQGASVGMCLI